MQRSASERWLSTAEPVPPFVVPRSRPAWELERKKISKTLLSLLGKLPRRPRLPRARIHSRQNRGDLVVEKFSFDNGAGDTVPGYVLLPGKLSGKAPGILFCHWHGGEYGIGKEELFQSRHTPEAPGPALVKRGFVVLAIDACCFGERNGAGPGGPGDKGSSGEMTASKFNSWMGRTLWGMILRDDLMALDYLASRPEVDASQLAVTGTSMGATRTWWLMALDKRLKTGVAVGCLTRYQNLIQHEALNEHGIYYYVPNLLNAFDTEAIVALIAPRPVLFQTGEEDAGSPFDGICAIESAVRPVYEFYGKEKNFQSITYPGLGHVYAPEMWNRTLAWMEEKLKVRAGSMRMRKTKSRRTNE